VFVPWLLFRSMRGHDTPSNFSLISKNLVQWTLAFLLVTVAFVFGDHLTPEDSPEALQVGTAASALMIGMLLSNQTTRWDKTVGLLTFEGVCRWRNCCRACDAVVGLLRSVTGVRGFRITVRLRPPLPGDALRHRGLWSTPGRRSLMMRCRAVVPLLGAILMLVPSVAGRAPVAC
jgi:hypothetical protein